MDEATEVSVKAVGGTSEHRRRAAISALTLAFARDPVMRFLYPEPEASLENFPAFAAAFGGPSFAPLRFLASANPFRRLAGG